MAHLGAGSMTNLLVSGFDFDLPPELIAQQPPAQRGASRMLAVDRATGALRDTHFADLPSLLRPGDLLVLNDSRVIPARLFGHKASAQPTTGRIEVLLTEPVAPPFAPSGARVGDGESELVAPPLAPSSARVGSGPTEWRALVKPARKVAIGDRLEFLSPSGEIALAASVLARGDFGQRTLLFDPTPDFFAALDRIGHIPLPPYIRRADASEDRDRYQTVFARDPGSVAAPTAGLHFTQDVLAQLSSKGIKNTRVTLHVGLGTFAPLRVDRLDQVHLHSERYTISPEAAVAINLALREHRRIVAVGTTVVRTLESAALASPSGPIEPHSGTTDIFISPGFDFRVVSALLTNFHLPQSSLLMLVSAFAGPQQTGIDRTLAAYRHAIAQQYRFFSYGDCMLIQ